MPDNIKKVLLKKKVGNVVYDVYTQSSADIIKYNNDGTETTVQAFLASLASTVASNQSANSQALTDLEDTILKRIIGETDEHELATIRQDLDTMQEIVSYINTHDTAYGTLVSNFETFRDTTYANDKSAIEARVTTLENAGATKVESSNTNGNIKINGTETTVYSDTALSGRVTTLENAGYSVVESSNTNGSVKIDNVDTVVYNDSALAGRVTTLENVGATKVESSTTNGNIKINGAETQVYDESALAGRVTNLENTGATKVEASETNGKIKINNVETMVYNDTALSGRVTTLEEAGYSVVTDGATNGYINIDGTEVQIYNDSAIPAANITESTTKRFVTDTEKAAWNNSTNVIVSTAAEFASATVGDNDLYMVELS